MAGDGEQGRALTTFLALKAKEISASAGIVYQHGNSYLHSKQALLTDIRTGGMKRGVAYATRS